MEQDELLDALENQLSFLTVQLNNEKKRSQDADRHIDDLNNLIEEKEILIQGQNGEIRGLKRENESLKLENQMLRFPIKPEFKEESVQTIENGDNSEDETEEQNGFYVAVLKKILSEVNATKDICQQVVKDEKEHQTLSMNRSRSINCRFEDTNGFISLFEEIQTIPTVELCDNDDVEEPVNVSIPDTAIYVNTQRNKSVNKNGQLNSKLCYLILAFLSSVLLLILFGYSRMEKTVIFDDRYA
ncbi:hypothetical protein ACOME3_007892 [Neoechinorhynchus agilis]